MAFLINYNQKELSWKPAPVALQNSLLRQKDSKYNITPEATILFQKFDSRYAFFYLAQYEIRKKLRAKLLTKHPMIVLQFAVKGGYSTFHHQKIEIKEDNCQLVYYPEGYELPFEIEEDLILMMLECRLEILKRLFYIDPLLEKYAKAMEEQSEEFICSPEYPIDFDLRRVLEKFLKLEVVDQNEMDFETEKFLADILLNLFRAFTEFSELRKPETEKENEFYTIKNYIENNLHRRLHINDLCKDFHITKNTLCRRFIHYQKMPIGKFITQVKINKAKEYLENTDRSIEDISESLGFQSRSSFSNAFKLKTSLAPSDYRLEHFKRKNGET